MNGKTVLVTDDEPHIRHMLDYKLKKTGFSVLTAGNGREAFDLARTHRPDVIVTDYQMPVCNGMEFAVRLKGDPETASIPVLLLTSRGHKVPASELAKTNVRALMPKPFSPRELIAQIEELILTGRSSEGETDEGAVAA
jgi:two-component system alkaline phosphatase synthesis response regulator PhoP